MIPIKVAEDRSWVLFFQYSITPTLHKYVGQSSVIKSPLPGGKPKPGPLSLDSLLGKNSATKTPSHKKKNMKVSGVRASRFRGFGFQGSALWILSLPRFQVVPKNANRLEI